MGRADVIVVVVLVVVVAVSDTLQYTTYDGPAARAGPSKRVGHLMGRVDVVMVAATVHHISWSMALAGP